MNSIQLTKYSCAAKHKSTKALHGEYELFDQLRKTTICTTNTIMTHLILPLKSSSLNVESDRTFLHHEVIEGQLKFEVPENKQQRWKCYQSQLLTLLSSIIGADPTAIHDISVIFPSSLRDLNEILIE